MRASTLALTFVFCVGTAISGCSTLPPGSSFPKKTSVAQVRPEQTADGSKFAAEARAHSDNSAFYMISIGADGFAARMQMVKAAQYSLDLQYYIFTADSTGRLLTKELLSAADRGIHVRILIDDGSTKAGDEQILVLSAHPNVEVRIFNPFFYRGHVPVFRAIEFALNSKRLDYRMHNKLFVVDNAMALIGGRNVGDAYFQVSEEAQYADDDAFVGGPVVQKLSSTFDEYWNSALAIPVAALPGGKPSAQKLALRRKRLDEHWAAAKLAGLDYLKRAEQGQPLDGILSGKLPLIWAPARIVCDSPEKNKTIEGTRPGRLMYGPIAAAVKSVKSELLMITPYLVPAPEEMRLLHSLRQNNIRVRILTNSLNSNNELTAHAGYTHFRRRLLEDGVELHEVRALLSNDSRGSGQGRAISRFGNYGLHAKLFVFDRSSVYAGSMNFDQRSHRLNTETGLIIDSPELAQQTAARFELMTRLTSSYAVTLKSVSGKKESVVWDTIENDRAVEYTREPSNSSWRRAQVRMLSMLPIDDEL